MAGKVTLSDVARQADVSLATVDRVLTIVAVSTVERKSASCKPRACSVSTGALTAHIFKFVVSQ